MVASTHTLDNSSPLVSSVSANTRVIKQSSLQKFQDEMGAVKKDPYRVVMKQSRLPMSLLHDRVKAHVSTKQGRINLGTL